MALASSSTNLVGFTRLFGYPLLGVGGVKYIFMLGVLFNWG